MSVVLPVSRYNLQKVTRMPSTRERRYPNSRFAQLRGQLEQLQPGEI